ncbi:FecR family protein [Chitinophaga solisilvae]|uniref:FecR family protein n=1 Tax=Chitinophaga solisilvae TaxID=1233460 RepID=UPI0013698092|nr:FecR domain-containing protein [Chitinophaga solisilvae]
MMPDQQQWRNYIDNTVTDKERKEMLYWLQEQEDAVWQEQLSAGWQVTAPPMPAAAAAALHQHLMAVTGKTAAPRKVIRLRWWWAAALLLPVAVCLWILQPGSHTSQEPATVAWKEIRNNGSYVSRITLPDNSRVWLTPQSALRIPEDYAMTQRSMELSGEAYFDIAPQAGMPLDIHAGSIHIAVLGTGFSVEAYPGESAVAIALASGKVAVKIPMHHRKDSTLLLSPGGRLLYMPATGRYTLGRFPVEDTLAWKQGALILDDIPVTAVFNRLSQRFSTKIKYDANAFRQARFSGRYGHPDLHLILKNMSFIHGFRYHIAGDSVIIH